MNLERVAVVIQKGSGTSAGAKDKIEAAFGGQLLSIVEVCAPDELRFAITEAQRRGAEVIAVGGGDGTLGLAADICIKRDLAMGIIPTGTGNALAHELNIPMDPISAVKLIESGIERRIDVGNGSGKRFVTVASLGVSSNIARLLNRMGKSRIGRWAYIPAVLQAIHDSRPVTISIDAGDNRFQGKVMQLVISSSRMHGGPFPVTESACIDDGLLSVYAVTGEDKWSLVRYGLYLIRGKQELLPDVWAVEAKSVTVRLHKTRRFILDGDPKLAREMNFTSEYRALRTIVRDQ